MTTTTREKTQQETRSRAPGYVGLQRALRQRIDGEVRFDDGSRALYATDASNYRQVPIGVVIPRDRDDVVNTIAVAHSYGVPVLSRGGGTSLAGQCCNAAVVLDMSKYYNHLLQLNEREQWARVEPGIVLDELRNRAEEHHLTFAPDPATHNHCTLGGMIGNNSCGVHSVMGGKTVDNVLELDVLTYDGLELTVGPTSDAGLHSIINAGGRRGEIYAGLRDLRDRYAGLIRERYPQIPRRVSGYNLDDLLPENGFNVARALVGTESTCVTVLGAKLRLVGSPKKRVLAVIGWPDIYTAGDAVPEVMESGPIALEGIDDRLVGYMRRKGLRVEDVRLLPDGGGWLLAEFGGDSTEEAREQAENLQRRLQERSQPPAIEIIDDPDQQGRIWKVRESGLGATAFVPGMKDAWPGWEDSAVPPEKLGAYLRDFRGLLEKHGYECSLYGHFGQGCLHVRIDFELTSDSGIKNYRSFVEEAANTVVRYGGSLSGEHGDGQSRGELLPRMYGHELVEAFREFKSIWDPTGSMNPGKVVEPYRLDENLRLGTSYAPPEVETHFSFPVEGDFARATLRCVGVGECRRHEGGTMCPSYMVTREEKHSTRGRARLLFEMMQGNPLQDRWQSEAVKEALDLCLACKGCKGDCPVNVDMATYKSEFLSHYFEGRLRPRSAYAFGLIFEWARWASRLPDIVNFTTQTPGLSRIAKLTAGMAPQRSVPRFARQTFRSYFDRRGRKAATGTRVILWPDTFNNYFLPDTAKAALEVLENAGFDVDIPSRALCCGRPLYDYGMLDHARSQLSQILDTLRSDLRRGTPVIVLEPSCLSVFRDEMTNLMPHDVDAQRLRDQAVSLDEFLAAQSHLPTLLHLNRKAIFHGHCHQKSVLGTQSIDEMLARAGLDCETLDSGCCGMAGSFGFEAGEHYDVSVKAGERVLIPAVQAADDSTLVIADGFSCREQVMQMAGKRPLHTAEVLRMALGTDREPDAANEAATKSRGVASTLAIAAASLALAGVARRLTRR